MKSLHGNNCSMPAGFSLFSVSFPVFIIRKETRFCKQVVFRLRHFDGDKNVDSLCRGSRSSGRELGSLRRCSLSDHDRAWPVGIFNTQIPVSQPAVDNCFFCFTENGKIFFRFSVLHKYQISFFFPVARIAFGWSRESPSRSHRSCWRVISLASDGERGHWKRPSPSSLLCIRTHPSRSWYRAFSLLVLRPQNRNTDLEYGSSW